MGVLQLINATSADGDIISFRECSKKIAESLASQASMSLSKDALIQNLKLLFESGIKSMISALGKLSPHTGAHGEQVPIITMMIEKAVSNVKNGPFKDFSLTTDEQYVLKLASWMHDIGKIAIPHNRIEKETKLQIIYDIINEIQWRFASLKKESEIQLQKIQIQFLQAQVENKNQQIIDHLKKAYKAQLLAHEKNIQQWKSDHEFLQDKNTGRTKITPEDTERIHKIAKYTVTTFEEKQTAMLSIKEIEYLNIPKGTLTQQERAHINEHVPIGVSMMNSLPLPHELKDIPKIAGGHHERMNGKGYPQKLTGDKIPIQTRIMAIADIFEALTAHDRPYKKKMALSESIQEMNKMVKNGHIDPDIFFIFIKEEVYLAYAKKHLSPEQIDTTNLPPVLETIYLQYEEKTDTQQNIKHQI